MAARPLAGQRVLVTRPREQARELVEGLEALGAEVVVVPMIAIAPPADWAPLDRALEGLADFDWLVLTSPNAREALLGRLQERGIALPGSLGWATVGRRTAEGLEARGIRAPLVAEPATAERLAELLIARGIAGSRVLFPRGDRAREVLPAMLSAAGAVVEAPIVYRTVPAPGRDQVVETLGRDRLDWIVLTSPSTWQELIGVLDEHLPSGVRLAAIGPTTAAAVRAGGHDVACMPDQPGVTELLAAMAGRQGGC